MINLSLLSDYPEMVTLILWPYADRVFSFMDRPSRKTLCLSVSTRKHSFHADCQDKLSENVLVEIFTSSVTLGDEIIITN